MKRVWIGISATFVVLASSLQVASASTSNSYDNQRTMSIGSYSARVNGIAAMDSGHLTEFIPIFYLESGLNKLGYQTTWNGTRDAFNITTPSGFTATLTKRPAQNGDMTFYVNGLPIVNAPKPIVAKDPASGVATSYVAIYYLSEVLKLLGFTTVYDGTAGTWEVTPPAPPT